ncbi:MAG: ROK family protein [Candidatus Omnitrophota bacterium]
MPNKFYIGIDIGGTKIFAGLVTQNGKILNREKISTPKNSSPKKVTQILKDIIDDLIYSQKLSVKNIAGIGLGIPGIIAPSGKIVKTPNMELSGFDLVKDLKKEYPVRIAAGNDVNLGLLGEKWLGAARAYKNAVSLFVGTGLGAGVLVDGKLFLGAHGAACEIGHMIVENDGPLCNCGNKGCLEAFVGRWAIEKEIKKAISDGHRTVIKRFLEKDNRSIKSKMIARALKAQDPVVVRIMKDVSRVLGLACISLRHVFDPEIIILGGGVVEACGSFMIPIIKKTFSSDKLLKGLNKCPVVVSTLGDDAIILGSVALVCHS